MEKIFVVSIEQLARRPIIRNDQPHESLNKLTNDELKKTYSNINKYLDNEKIHGFPERNVQILTMIVDYDIIYHINKEK